MEAVGGGYFQSNEKILVLVVFLAVVESYNFPASVAPSVVPPVVPSAGSAASTVPAVVAAAATAACCLCWKPSCRKDLFSRNL